jgi:hypothetical protein
VALSPKLIQDRRAVLILEEYRLSETKTDFGGHGVKYLHISALQVSVARTVAPRSGLVTRW